MLIVERGYNKVWMMNDSMNEYQLTRNFEYRQYTLMEEARRERLKAEVMRAARQQRRLRRLRATNDVLGWLRTRFLGFQQPAVDKPCYPMDDCLETSLT